jgi:hypothetical protein
MKRIVFIFSVIAAAMATATITVPLTLQTAEAKLNNCSSDPTTFCKVGGSGGCTTEPPQCGGGGGRLEVDFNDLSGTSSGGQGGRGTSADTGETIVGGGGGHIVCEAVPGGCQRIVHEGRHIQGSGNN